MGTSSALIKFCATGKSGLGHLRRTTNIAAALRARAPEQPLALITNATVSGLAMRELELFDEIVCAPRTSMANVLAGMRQGPVVIDTAVIEGAGVLPDPLCLVLRETTAAKLPDFRLFNGRLWDRVIIPAPRDHWSPCPEAIGASAIVHAGWIYRSGGTGGLPPLEPRHGVPRILVATGGGGTPETALALKQELDAVLAALKANGPGVEILQVAGPRLGPEGRLAGAGRRVDVGSRLNEAFADSDVVITTVGYNSILELAGLTTPALLVPIPRTYDDQSVRAEQWGPRLGLAHRNGDALRSASWLRAILASAERRPAVDLGPSGDAAAAETILAMRVQDASVLPRWRFRKTQADEGVMHVQAAQARSTTLFRAGVPTPPARLAADGKNLDMATIQGETLRQRWRGLGAPFEEPYDVAELLTAGGSWLTPLVSLHHAVAGADLQHLDLSALDAMAKVRKRLTPELVTARLLTEETFDELHRTTDAVTQALAAERKNAQTPEVIVHGDLHAGQILMPADGSKAWIIDLDDLALGPVEFDLANFVANIVTASGLYAGSATRGFPILSSAISDAYTAAGGRRPDPAAMRVYGAASLLRRALKLAGARRQWPSTAEICEVVHTLLRPFPTKVPTHQHRVPVTGGIARHTTG